MRLSEKQRKHLRRLAHALSPVVMIGQDGLTPGVVAETERALSDHELIKVRARGEDRATREAAIVELARRTAADIVQRIGHVAVLYKPRLERPRVLIPDD